MLATIAGPWTDDPSELAGWDAERFVEIADASGRPWRDHPVEYPPGSVALIEGASGADGVTGMSDRIAVIAALADLAILAVLLSSWGERAAASHLALGGLLAPLAYQRLDLVAAALVVIALAAARRGHAGRTALAFVAGVAVKLFPLVLAPALVLATPQHRRRRVTGCVAAALAATTAVWLRWAGVDALSQVVGFRGALGIHIESVPGQLYRLVQPEAAVIEMGSYRFGTPPGWFIAGATMLGLVAIARVWTASVGGNPRQLVIRTVGGSAAPIQVGTASLAAVICLLLSSSLFSPQFMIWLAPLAAIAHHEGSSWPVRLTAASIAVTQLTHLAWHPSGLDAAAPQLALSLRSALLVVAVVAAFREMPAPTMGATTGTSPRPV